MANSASDEIGSVSMSEKGNPFAADVSSPASTGGWICLLVLATTAVMLRRRLRPVRWEPTNDDGRNPGRRGHHLAM